jgi:hypothetical protein
VLLAPKDLAVLFRLHRSLMFFVNQKLEVLPRPVANPDAYSSLPPSSRFKVHDAMRKHMDLIGAFVDANPAGFPREELDIVASWQHLVHGKFYIFRELTNYTVFLSAETPATAYGVLALSQPFEELVGPHLPVMVQATLLPFKDQIVYDGLMSTFNIFFGPGIRRSLNEDFKEAKARRGIVTSLPIADRPIAAPSTKANRPQRGHRTGKTSDPAGIEAHFPAVAAFVRDGGHIEIGDQEGFGFVARALDYGGLVFEGRKVNTLADAMAALEKGLACRTAKRSSRKDHSG